MFPQLLGPQNDMATIRLTEEGMILRKRAEEIL